MSPFVFGLVALAAVMHVAWNVLLKTTGDPLRTSGRAVIAGTVVAVPLATAAWLATGRPAIPAEAIGLAVVSGIVEVAYFVLLSAAYQRGDLSLVYPIARGTAPLLAVASGVLLLGERLGVEGAAGVVALLFGILAIRRPWGALAPLLRRGSGVRSDARQPSADSQARRARQAVILALATGAVIAVYSSIDRVGSRLTEPWLYGVMLWTVCAAGLWMWIRVADRRAAARSLSGALAAIDPPGNSRFTDWGRPTGIGLLLLVAYLLILAAFAVAPLTAVAPLRESAIVLASGWGALRLREASGRREAILRIGGAMLIVVGAVLLALDG